MEPELAWGKEMVEEKKNETALMCICVVAQLVKNLPAMQETLVQFLGREDPTCLRATKPMGHNC